MLAVSVAFTSNHVVYDYLLPAKYDKNPNIKYKEVDMLLVEI